MPLLVGIVTMYALDAHAGLPLFCATYSEPATFSPDAPPWIALDVSLYHSGLIECGDPVLVIFEDGSRLTLRALDAGPLDQYCVEDMSGCVPIVGDVPEPHWTQPYIGAYARVVLLGAHWRLVAEERRQQWM